MKLLLGKATEKKLMNFFSGRQHAAILLGQSIDLFSDQIAKLANQRVKTVSVYLKPEEKVITIEQIRSLKQSLSLRQKQTEQRLLIIEQADLMTLDAQNSLLKLLEEPPSGVRFVLIASYEGGILPTISSRCIKLQTAQLDYEEAINHYRSEGPTEELVKKSYAIADGQPGKLASLLCDSDNGYAAAIQKAKDLLSTPVYNRLLYVDKTKEQSQALQLLEAIDDVLRAASHSSASTEAKIMSFAKKRKILLSAREALMKNSNTKLVLTDTFISL